MRAKKMKPEHSIVFDILDHTKILSMSISSNQESMVLFGFTQLKLTYWPFIVK
jgi:hypothetical protein